MFFVYILKSNTRYYYGVTDNIRVRLLQHNAGKVRSTKTYRPWKLFKTEMFATRSEAMRREQQIKRSGRIRKRLQRGPIV